MAAPIIMAYATEKYLYHGSKFKIDRELEPRPSRVINGENAVFATNDRWLALAFIPGSGRDLDIGCIEDDGVTRCHVIENKPGVFKSMEQSGYIYKVSAQGFRNDSRLGMQRHEFINNNAVPVLGVETIDNVMDELRKEDIDIVPFDQRLDYIKKYDIPTD